MYLYFLDASNIFVQYPCSTEHSIGTIELEEGVPNPGNPRSGDYTLLVFGNFDQKAR